MLKFITIYLNRRKLLKAAKKVHVGTCHFCCQAIGFDTNKLSHEFVSAFWKGSNPHSLGAFPVSTGWPLWNDTDEEEREQRVLALLLYREFIRTE